MDFGFSEDQQLLRETLHDFLRVECPPDRVRAQWDTPTGRDDAFWRRFAEIGVPGLGVSEAHGGLGLDERDAVLLWEETGRAALAEPVVATAVGAALLRDAAGAGGSAAGLAAAWLPRVAAGGARLAVAHPVSPFVADAHVADLLLVLDGDACAALETGAREDPERWGARLVAQPCVDPGQRLFTLATPGRGDAGAVLVAEGGPARVLADSALDRGALASAAQALGVAERLLALAVDYAGQRVQFGVPIGSFQAVKHMLADVRVALEYARSHVYRAAWSVAVAADTRAADVSMAKLAACEAAAAAARTSLQVHGAIGYTYEQDVHVWMKRAWSLERAWGDAVFHRRRLCDAVIDGAPPARSFGYEPASGAAAGMR